MSLQFDGDGPLSACGASERQSKYISTLQIGAACRVHHEDEVAERKASARILAMCAQAGGVEIRIKLRENGRCPVVSSGGRECKRFVCEDMRQEWPAHAVGTLPGIVNVS